jgi:hypothetical protein
VYLVWCDAGLDVRKRPEGLAITPLIESDKVQPIKKLARRNGEMRGSFEE